MVNIKLPFSSVKQILKACPFPWKADLSSGEKTDKHLPLTLAFIRYLRRCLHTSALVCYVLLTNRLSPPNFYSMQWSDPPVSGAQSSEAAHVRADLTAPMVWKSALGWRQAWDPSVLWVRRREDLQLFSLEVKYCCIFHFWIMIRKRSSYWTVLNWLEDILMFWSSSK